MSDSNLYKEYEPINTNVPIQITGMEYFGEEQNQNDLNEIVNNNKENTLQIIGRFDGTWDGELDDAVKTATKVRYADRIEHKDYLYEVYDFTLCPIIGSLPIRLGFVKNKYHAQIQMQRPGCVMPRHKDPKSIFTVYNEYELKSIRVLIALAHWEYGQMMCFENKILTGWSKGDIIYCDFTSTWHFTANCSYHSRPLLQITGVASNKLLQSIQNKEFRVFSI